MPRKSSAAVSDPTGRGSSAWVTAIRRRVFPAPTMKLLAMTMADYVDGDDLCWPGNALLSVELGVSERQVQSLLARLEALGILTKGEPRQRKERARGRPRTTWVFLYAGLSQLPLAVREIPETSSGKSEEIPEVQDSITGSPARDLPEVQRGPSSFRNPPVEPPKEPTARLARFDDFWSVFPLHKAKAAAEKAWPTAVKRAGSAEVVIAGAAAYREWLKEEPARLTAYPATWLNGGRWDDDLEPPKQINGHKPVEDVRRCEHCNSPHAQPHHVRCPRHPSQLDSAGAEA